MKQMFIAVLPLAMLAVSGVAEAQGIQGEPIPAESSQAASEPKPWYEQKEGVGVGGGLDYRFLVAFQLDVLTFNYKMRPNLWIDFGIPTIRFHIETANQARYNAQFVFPLGITFAI